jgi:hypothetical protein
MDSLYLTHSAALVEGAALQSVSVAVQDLWSLALSIPVMMPRDRTVIVVPVSRCKYSVSYVLRSTALSTGQDSSSRAGIRRAPGAIRCNGYCVSITRPVIRGSQLTQIQ